MPIHKNDPRRFTPRGLCDAYDATDAFPGACQTLQNLIFSQSNPEIMVSRPGVGLPVTSFAGFSTPTFVSVFIAIGTMIYGMVSTSRFAGHDEPFAFNLLTSTFTTITGSTAANTPVSQSTSGDWTPLTMAVIGPNIVVTSPGFPGTGGVFFGVIGISNPAAPTWVGTNLAINPLTAVPTAVANFNNRAYYAVGNSSYYSDSLIPAQATNAGQAITHGDTTPITGYAGLPAVTTSSGIVQALLVFKQSQIWQITGDAATGSAIPLANNFVSLSLGCNSPRTILETPVGTIFMAVDGPYYVDAFGTIHPLTREPKSSEQDVQVPFQNTTLPTRMTSGFSGSIYRVCVDTQIAGVAQTNDYWFDLNRKRWTGPHTFPYDEIAQVSNYFIISDRTLGAMLFKSTVLPLPSSIYTDNGAALTSVMLTSSLPKDGRMAERQVVESTIELANISTLNYTVSGLDDQLNVLSQVLVETQGPGTLWGAANWGAFDWASGVTIPHVYNIPWSQPLVFQKLQVNVTVTASNSVAMGTQFHRFEDAGYTNLDLLNG